MSHPLPPLLSVELRLGQAGLDIQAQFRVPPGRVCALVGRPGSGKVALMQCAAGLLKASSGRITSGQQVLYDAPARVNLPPQQRRFAWVDGHSPLFPHLSAQGNLIYGLRHPPRKGAPGVDTAPAPTLPEVVELLGLGGVLAQMPAQLSPVLRQKVALGRALLAAPKALFLNDPLAEVPAHEQDSLLHVMAELLRKYKTPTVLRSPRMDEVIRLADDVVIMHEGRVASAGPLGQILSDVSLSTFLEGVHAGSVLEGTVRQHDIQWLLSEIDVVGQRVVVPAVLHGEGKRVRLKIRARDVSIHRQPLSDPGITNQLRGRIAQVMLAGDHGSYGAVAIDVLPPFDAQIDSLAPKSERLWALMTRRSIQQMDLAPGQDCFASFKSMAVSVAPR